MNTSIIENLLNRYYEGETTLEEEKVLREFFSGKDIPPHLAEHAPLFSWASAEREETFEPEINLPADEPATVPLYRHRTVFTRITAIAATLLILFGIVFLLRQAKEERSRELQARIAYEQTREALMILSVNLNTGIDQMQQLQNFQKGLERVQTLSTFYKYQTIVINPDQNQRPQNHIQ